ncbi:bis(5'-nucleosyl)-tetraphosphatase (symmetrical) YqeK [Spirochaeta cellobiosiphila]|uniref:bis(5'-nucleosyl)-tetraphosphatase (symmetrical) YqeK n=1 Tax=Spirochaeta cellobiosiphila TaxID=504483 RepID=UPI00069FB02A|nr:bis(5'-nucleosyl)-tetraphosphatase (symmetrical) YqeK [Spirochaeta cellobiosiphila]
MKTKKQIKTYLKENLSKKRRKHSKRTAKCAKNLAIHYGISKKKSYMAGLAHDIARELDDDELFSLVRKDGLPLHGYERNNPVLLHGRAGAVILEKRFKIKNSIILNAVRWHTLGRSGMSDVGKILFIADFIEPGRQYIDDGFRDMVLEKTLNEAVLTVIEQSRLLFPDRIKEIDEEIDEWIRELKQYNE